MKHNIIGNLDYHGKLKELHRLIDKAGTQYSNNLTPTELNDYDYLTVWYENNHRAV